MEKRMERSLIYNGTITAEQFLFYEIRIASKYYIDGTSVEDAIEEIKRTICFNTRPSGLFPVWCEAAISVWMPWMMNSFGRNYRRLRLRLQSRSTSML